MNIVPPNEKSTNRLVDQFPVLFALSTWSPRRKRRVDGPYLLEEAGGYESPEVVAEWAAGLSPERRATVADEVEGIVESFPQNVLGLLDTPDALKAVATREEVWLEDPFRLLKRLLGLPEPELEAIFANPASGVLWDRRGRSEWLREYARDVREDMVRVHNNGVVTRVPAPPVKPDPFAGFNIVRHYGNQPVVGRFDAHGKFQHQTFAAFKASYNDKVEFDAEGKAVPLAAKWLVTADRFDRAEFLPGEVTDDDVLNLWEGFRVRPAWDGLVPPRLYDHLLYNVCGGDDDLLWWFLGWCADLVLNPHRTSEVAVVMTGPMGSGKSMLANFLGELVAPNYIVLEKPDQLVGRFNTHLMTALLVFADEAFFAGNKQAANTLKTLVTSPEIFVEPKGVDGFMARKVFRLLFASNDKHVVDAAMDDRRYLVLKVDADANNKSADYFGALMKEWRNGGREALLGFLMSDYWREAIASGEWRPQDRPVTKALMEQRELSLKGPELVVANMLRSGEVPCDFEVDSRGRVFVPTHLLAERTRLRLEDETPLGRLLAELSGVPSRKERLGEGPARRQYRGYWLPLLRECRERFGRGIDYTGLPEEWDVEAQARAAKHSEAIEEAWEAHEKGRLAKDALKAIKAGMTADEAIAALEREVAQLKLKV